MHTLFQLMVLLHLICVIGGFGAIIYNGLAFELARRRNPLTAAGVLDVDSQIAQFGEILLYGVFLFGIGAVVTSQHHLNFGLPWVSAGLGLFVAMIGVRHAMVRPAERRSRAALLELARQPSLPPPGRPPQMDELDSLARRIAIGSGAFNVLLLAAIVVMVIKP
jgi:hypothetical protein